MNFPDPARLDVKRFRISLLVSTVLFAFAAAALAQTPSEFLFRIDGDETGWFPILEQGDEALVKYELPSGEQSYGRVSLAAGLGLDSVYSEPLFCFDFSDPSEAAVLVDVEDPNGHVIADSLVLTSALRYVLAENEVRLNPSSTVQCFYNGGDIQNPEFGLFGVDRNAGRGEEEVCDPQVETCEVVFSDSFFAVAEIEVSFENFLVGGDEASLVDGVLSVNAGDDVEYDLVIRNHGKVAADFVALQEIFPTNAGVFSAALTEGSWTCTDNAHDEICPASSGEGPLRFEDMFLPARQGEVVPQAEFRIARTVDAAATDRLNVHAGAVNGPGNLAAYDVARFEMSVIGQPAAIRFKVQPGDTALGNSILDENGDPVVVQVVDDSGNLVTDFNSGEVDLDLYQDGIRVLQFGSAAFANGEATFQSLPTDDVNASTGYVLWAKPAIAGFDDTPSDPFDITQPD